MPYRVLAVLLPLLLALTLVVLSPASAGQRTATTTITDHGDCSFTVTYEWTGFPGTGLDAQLALAYREVGGLNVFFAFADFPDQLGSDGSVAAKFTLSGTPTSTHPYFGRGALLAPAKKGPYTQSSVRGSVVYSGDVDTQACGSTVTVTPETSLS
jgi:hypothetical protein